MAMPHNESPDCTTWTMAPSARGVGGTMVANGWARTAGAAACPWACPWAGAAATGAVSFRANRPGKS